MNSVSLTSLIAALTLCCGRIRSSALECSPVPSSISPSDVSTVRTLPASIQAVFPSLRFECDGLVTGGVIQASGDLNIDLQIWRPQGNSDTSYNLVWQREFRRRSSTGGVTEVSFTALPGVPVGRGDVIGFHSFVSTQLLFDPSQQHEVSFVTTEQGPLCNFSRNGAGVRSLLVGLPQFSLTFENATEQEITAAEQSLPNIGDSCTVVAPAISVPTDPEAPSSDTVTRGPTMSSSSPSSRSSQGPSEVTTGSSSSDLLNSPGATEEEPTDGFFLSLTRVEFILVVTILVIVFISICVVITIALCCCMYVQRISHCRGKEEAQMSMNANPVYDTITTQTAGQTPCAGVQPPCAGGPQPTLVALVQPPCAQTMLSGTTNLGCQQNLSSSRQTLSSMDSINSFAGLQRMTSTDTDAYSYPNLRLALQERNSQRTSDGYIVVQPDHYVQNNSRENIVTDTAAEQRGPRGLLDHTL